MIYLFSSIALLSMKSPFSLILILMMLAVIYPASAQYAPPAGYNTGYNTGYDTGYNTGYNTGYDTGHNTGYDTGYYTDHNADYTCWQCPVCGFTIGLTSAEADSIDPYDLCPICYSAYAGSFIPVDCSENMNSLEREDVSISGGKEDSLDRTAPIAPIPYRSDKRSGNDTAPVRDELSPRGKILMVLPPDQYQEEELNVPRNYFQNAGYQVQLASKGVKTATGMDGEKTEVDLELDEVNLSEYIAVVFVGGEGIYSDELHKDPAYQNLARSALKERKVVAAICLGPWILADAGLLQGKRATASDTDHIKSKGAIVADEMVVQDGMIITASGPDASQEFARTVLAALEASSSTAGSLDLSQEPKQ